VAVIAVVVGFGSATALGSAYGVAVTGTFLLNTILFLAVAHLLWRTRPAWIVLGAAVFGTMELAFFSSTLTKVVHGGWVPLAIAAIVFTVLTTWHRGREIMIEKRARRAGALRDFVASVKSKRDRIQRVPGTAVFLNADPGMTPMALWTNFEHNHVLHENVVVMTITVDRVPHVRGGDRLQADPLGDPEDGIALIGARLGYHDSADIPALLRLCTRQGLLERRANLDEASYFVSRAILIRTKARGMPRWRKRLFVVLWHNAASPVEFFRLPEDRTVTLGGQIGI
jgi:KUP system potassium uptake protein